MVRPDVDARLFTDADGLADALAGLVGGAASAPPPWPRCGQGRGARRWSRWDDGWRAAAAPLPRSAAVTAPAPLRVAFVHPVLGLGGASA
ncbi:MAG: hypothetical protein U0802_14015 [Candidatus Binatia bacterium]